jgi:hypothetical protein
MTLHEKAYLVVSENAFDDTVDDAVFEMQIGKQQTTELNKSYLMGERGQYLREITAKLGIEDIIQDTSDVDNRRTGYWIDGGAGTWQETIEFETGLEDVRWGDGVSATGPANVTETDASGEDVKKRSRADIFTYWISRTITDSANPGLLYVGEWTDGRFEGDSGAFGRPMYIAVNDHNISTDVDRPAGLRGTVTVSRIDLFPDVLDDGFGTGDIPGWLQGGFDDFLTGIGDALGIIPDE